MAPPRPSLLVQACFAAAVALAAAMASPDDKLDPAMVIREAYGNYRYERCWKPLAACRGEMYSFLNGVKDQLSPKCCSHVKEAMSHCSTSVGSPIPRSIRWACRHAQTAEVVQGEQQGLEKKEEACSS